MNTMGVFQPTEERNSANLGQARESRQHCEVIDFTTAHRFSPKRILDRNSLFKDLAQAVSSDSPRSVLVLFGVEGLKEHLETVSQADGDELLDRIGERLGKAVGGFTGLYAPRRGEFCGLFDGGLGAIRPFLITVPVELDVELRPLSMRSSLGIAVLPDEATDPTYALSLADRRLRALSGDLRPANLSLV